MSAFVLSREYELQLPNSYVEIDSKEMEYLDGGGVYVSNSTIKAVLLASAINPLPAALVAIGYWKAVSLITAKFTLICAKLGSLGGPAGTAAGLIFGMFTAGSVAVTIVDALHAGKGIELGFTWRPTLEVR